MSWGLESLDDCIQKAGGWGVSVANTLAAGYAVKIDRTSGLFHGSMSCQSDQSALGCQSHSGLAGAAACVAPGDTMIGSLLKQIDVLTQGQRVKDVQCEKCQTQFAYVLQRDATGSATGIIFSQRNVNATRRASVAAERMLDKELSRKEDLVPCPVCGWVNEDMIRKYRKEKYYYRVSTYFISTIVAIPLMSCVGMMIMLPLASIFPRNHPLQWVVIVPLLILMHSGVFMPFFMMLYLRRKRQAVDPNVNWPHGPPVIPGNSPPAMLPVDVDEDGQFVYENDQ